MRFASKLMVIVALTLNGAIFGFFFAWVCSTMWGLDAADPRVAIAAMQVMNASVRNVVFAPAFFGTPFALMLAALLLFRNGFGRAAFAFGLAGLVYLVFGIGLTLGVNVPMNQALAQVAVPQDIHAAQAIWNRYSGDWQLWNHVRTVASGLAFMIALFGLLDIAGSRTQSK